MYSQVEFDVAFAKAKQAHPTISYALSQTVIKKMIDRWEKNRQKAEWLQDRFWDLMRLTLNELKIAGKANRQMYSALMGYYYGRRGAYAKARKLNSTSPAAKKQIRKRSAPPVTIVTGTNGQLAWQL